MSDIQNSQVKEWILGLNKEHKIMLLENAIKDKNVAAHLALVKILSEAPISEGGLPSDDIPRPDDPKFEKYFDEKEA